MATTTELGPGAAGGPAAPARSGLPHAPPAPTAATASATRAEQGHGAAVARGGARVLALRLASLAFGLGTSVLLARLLGAAGLGRYETAMSWAALLGVPAGLGAEHLVVRECAAARANGRFDVVRGLLRAAPRATAASAAAVAVAAALVLWGLGDRAPEGLWLAALVLVPIAALMRVRQALLQGLAHVVAGQSADLVVVPATLLAALLAVWTLGGVLSPTAAVACQVAAFATALAVCATLLRRRTPAAVRQAVPEYRWADWRRGLVPLFAIAVLNILNSRVDVAMLGALAPADEVGRYACANRLAGLVPLPLLAANAALAPHLAHLHAVRDRRALQRVVTRAARTTLALALPVALGLTLFGDVALGLFGDGFAAGLPALRLLCLAQLVNVGMGSVGLLLMMTGHARTAAAGLAASAALNLALDALLIPRLHGLGAAIATAASLVTWNVLLALGVRHTLRLRPGALVRSEPQGVIA